MQPYLLINLSHAMHATELPSVAAPKARKFAEKLLTLNDNLAGMAEGLLGLLDFIYEYDVSSAETHLKRARILSPTDAASMLTYAHVLACTGRSTDAKTLMDTAVGVDPTDAIVQVTRGWIYTLCGDRKAGLRHTQRATSLFPELPAGQMMLGYAHEVSEDLGSALEAYKRALALEVSPGLLGALGHIHGIRGENQEAMACLKRIEGLYKEKQIAYIPEYCRALIYIGLGETEKCFRALEESYNQRCSWLHQLRIDVRWRNIVARPRMKRLIKRVGL